MTEFITGGFTGFSGAMRCKIEGRGNRLIHKYFLLLIFCLLLCACASVPDFPEGGAFEGIEIRTIEPGLDIIVGRSSGGGIGWTAVRSQYALTVSAPEISGELTMSRHAGDQFSDSGVLAALTGSPHNPIRFRSGLEQDATGIYQVNGTRYSNPDGQHDAVGFDENKLPELLDPPAQMDWSGDAIGGFYTILDDGRASSRVPVRDAVSAVGWSEDRSTVILLVIRGREDSGFSYEEAGLLLRFLGAEEGMAMDGGGSARLTWRENGSLYSFPAGQFYRAVPNHLLIIAEGD